MHLLMACAVPLIPRLTDMHAPSAHLNVRAADIQLRPLAGAGQMRWYQGGEKIWPTVPGDVKSHNTISKSRFPIVCLYNLFGHENDSFLEGK